MHGFVNQCDGKNKLRKHILECKENAPARVEFPPKGKRTIKFNMYAKQLPAPVVAVCDFEAANEKVEDINTNSKTTYLTEHKISGFCIQLVSSYDCIGPFKPIYYSGPDAAEIFLREMRQINLMMEDMYNKGGKEVMKILTPQQQELYAESSDCHICGGDITCNLTMKQWQAEKILKKVNTEEEEESDPDECMESPETEDDFWKGPKVRDHCHWTGVFRGAAHADCNWRYHATKKIPVIFHNLSGYDGHLIFQHIYKMENIKAIEPVAKSLENFISFTWADYNSSWKLEFKDSLNFLGSSLDKLVKNLKIAADKSQTVDQHFKHTLAYFKKEWKHKPKRAFKMLLRKGFFPYQYFDSLEKLKEKQLPPQEAFYNDLTEKGISDEDYDFVRKVWKTFKIKNLKQYHDLYMCTDVMLLTDVFEYFRSQSLKQYKLDPAHFNTAPGLSWAAALKHTKVTLQVLVDPDKSLFVDGGMKGGPAFARNPILTANNPMIAGFKPEMLTAWMLLVDANNLYGGAMRQFLPYGNFKWIHDLSKFTPDHIMSLGDEDDKGYFLEVDLEYPKELHDLHDQYPLAPEHIQIDESMLSGFQKDLAKDLNVKLGGDKLGLTLYNKTKYICHYRNLKQYLSLGLKLIKVHRVLEFSQSPWLRSYIDLNTQLRRQANTKSEEELPKLMNNSFFGKTCEDVR